MSLYADEELGAAVGDGIDLKPSSSSGPIDPVQALTAALVLPSESKAQNDALVFAAQRFEEQPSKLPELCERLLGMVVEGEENSLRRWTLGMIGMTMSRTELTSDVKTQLAQSSLEPLCRLLASSNPLTIKSVIPIFSTIHPYLFKIMATSRPSDTTIALFRESKGKILDFAIKPETRPQNVGIRAAAWKFVQRVLLTGTRGPAIDPRLQNRNSTDPSIAMINRESTLLSAELEEEARMLQTSLVTTMFSSSDPSILHSIFNILPQLCKSRPTLAPLLVQALAQWKPAQLETANVAPIHIRSVEKTLRLVMGHLLRVPSTIAYAPQLNEGLMQQKQRVDVAFVAEQDARKMKREQAWTQTAEVKHEMEAESSQQGAKRARLQVEAGSGVGRGPEFDVSVFPIDQVIDVVMLGLAAIDPDTLRSAFDHAREAVLNNRPDAINLLARSLVADGMDAKTEVEEILNPLEMDVDDDDLLERQLADDDLEEPTTFVEFQLPPPEAIEPEERSEIVRSALERIWQAGSDLASLPNVDAGDGVKVAVQPKEMWMLLTARSSTRGGEDMQKALVDFVNADFAARAKFASVWLNEEWFNDKLNSTDRYSTILDQILKAYLPRLDIKDKALSSFLSAVPVIPPSIVTSLISLCEEPLRGVIGFIALRDLLEARPPIRDFALPPLLELCTHDDRKTRVIAIRTVLRWVPDSQMAPAIIKYALSVMRRLATATTEEKEDKMDSQNDDNPDNNVQSRFLSDVTVETIPQHVELAFALSRRQQDLLEDIFELYPCLEQTIADGVESQLTPLIQALGPTPKLLDVLRNFPPGAEKLALRVVTILSAEGASPVLVSLIKGLMAERELDPKFVIPIVGELDKDEIEKQIPRIVSLLGPAEARDLVRTAFASVLQKMTPADLLVSLHDEKAGRKAAMGAIGICFSMTSIFRSDVLAAALSRIVDLPTLPVVFLRTTIQAATTYKSLIPFIANNILPKLILKKVWEQAPLWDGFVLLAKMIAPASFGSLLQLPKEWLKDVLNRQASLKQGLKTFLANKGQRAAIAEIFGNDE